jgi:hypothetical protein
LFGLPYEILRVLRWNRKHKGTGKMPHAGVMAMNCGHCNHFWDAGPVVERRLCRDDAQRSVLVDSSNLMIELERQLTA